jgi:outer membrane protein assembly factor BamD
MKMQFLPHLILLSSLLVGCSSIPTDPTLEYAGKNPQTIYQESQTALSKKQYKKAIGALEALDTLYPSSPYQSPALLHLIYAHHQAKDYLSADMIAERYIHLFPRSPHVDYAYFMKGVANFDADHSFAERYLAINHAKRDISSSYKAFADFQQLLLHFPHSPYSIDARQRMVYLRRQFAQQELLIANYYLRQHLAVAAANRASQVVLHYQGTDQTEEALGILVKAYTELGLNDRAQQMRGVLKQNYPGSAFLT